MDNSRKIFNNFFNTPTKNLKIKAYIRKIFTNTALDKSQVISYYNKSSNALAIYKNSTFNKKQVVSYFLPIIITLNILNGGGGELSC